MVNVAGVFSVLPTPFLPNGAIDFDSLRRVVRLYLDAGVDGLTALGVTSETDQLGRSEREAVLRAVMADLRGSVPVVVGATAQDVSGAVENARLARELGAAAVMINPPRMGCPDLGAIRRHFREVSERIDLPIVVQAYTPASGFSMDATLLAALIGDLDTICAVKLEDPPTAPKIAELRRIRTREVPIVGGLGALYLLEELRAGSLGAMTGFSFPEALVEIVRLFRSGERERAAERFRQVEPLLRFEFQEGIGIAIRKEILRRRGAIQSATTRASSRPLDPEILGSLDRLLLRPGG